jgi:hypothetical protein
MKKIVFFLTVDLLISIGNSAQQVDDRRKCNNTLDSTLIKTEAKGSGSEVTLPLTGQPDSTIKSAGDPGAKPMPAQKSWCEGIGIANGEIIFKQVLYNGRLANVGFILDLSDYGINGTITNEHLKWQNFREIEVTNDKGKPEIKNVAYFVIEKDGASVLIIDMPKFKKNDAGGFLALQTSDGSKIFTEYEGAICILSDGTAVASSPTTLVAGNLNGIKDEKVYDKALGEGPDMVSPKIEGYVKSNIEFAKITDDSMPGQYMLYENGTKKLFLIDVPTVGMNK